MNRINSYFHVVNRILLLPIALYYALYTLLLLHFLINGY